MVVAAALVMMVVAAPHRGRERGRERGSEGGSEKKKGREGKREHGHHAELPPARRLWRWWRRLTVVGMEGERVSESEK
jgi:hypothetical protein